jgi:ATP-binding cassette subfamily B protein
VSEEELLRYSRLTGLDDYVRSLPDGYDTVIGSDLRSLPLAQARMVALTRLFLRHPKILVLDEAVAGIDPITGQSILDGLKDQIEGRTVILITHNAHLISQADYVLRIENGKVVRQ